MTSGSLIISCVVDDNAYPPATYRWINHVDGSQSTGPHFVLNSGTEYKLTCNASNDFNRSDCYATDYVEFNSKLMFHWFIVFPLYRLYRH